MPCPHNEISIVQRSQQQSAVAAAAYQSGEKLFWFWSSADLTGNQTFAIRSIASPKFWSSADLTGNQTAPAPLV